MVWQTSRALVPVRIPTGALLLLLRWSLYPPSITAVTTSAAETLVEVMHESAIDRAITGAL